MAAISPMTTDKSLELYNKLNLSYPMLSDKGNLYAKEIDLAFKIDESVKSVYLSKGLDVSKFNGDDSWVLPLPAVFLINKDGTVLYEWLENDYTQRPEPDDLLKELFKLFK